MQHFMTAPRAMAMPLTTEDKRHDAGALPNARRLLLLTTGAIMVLAMTVIGVVIYAVWQIDRAAIDNETMRARAALSTVTLAGPDASDQRRASMFANSFALNGAHFGAVDTVTPGEVSVPVPGDAAKLLIWTPKRFGSELFFHLAPIRVASCAVFMLGILFLMRRLYLVARELEQRRSEAQALAARDALTGLGNRLAFNEGIEKALAADSGEVGLFYLDLDGFKQVNDTLGHGAGDDVLRSVGERLTQLAGKDDVVARIGGDEFAVVRVAPGDTEALAAFARSIEAALEAPVMLGTSPVRVGASIGIAVAPVDGRSGAELLEAADVALYRAKRDRTGFAIAA